jgi:hypothetical protein
MVVSKNFSHHWQQRALSGVIATNGMPAAQCMLSCNNVLAVEVLVICITRRSVACPCSAHALTCIDNTCIC